MTRLLISLLASLGISFGCLAQINTDNVMRSGRSAIYFEDYVLSIQYFNQAIAAKPYLAQPYFYRALAKLNLDDFNGALSDADEAIERNPFLTDAYELRAVAYQNLGQPEKAIEDYRTVLKTLPTNRGILFNMAMALQDIGDFTTAAETYDGLLRNHPSFENGYVGRARLRLETGDTIGALADADKALSLNKNSVNSYLIKADIEANKNKDFRAALTNMDEAIRLQPRYAGFFINRAFIRKNLDDYYGALSDYEYASQLSPTDYVPIYNRALLLMEVRDFDKALVDLDKVIALHGPDIRTLYNRAIVRNAKRDFKGALTDINTVIKRYPTLAAGYFLRSQIKHDMGDQNYRDDYDRSIALATTSVQKIPEDFGGGHPSAQRRGDKTSGSPSTAADSLATTQAFDDELLLASEEPQEVVASRFSALLTVNKAPDLEQEFNNKQIRGRVQDRATPVDIEPMFAATYYSSPTELRPNSEYLREADDINRTRMLRFDLQVTNREPNLTDPEQIKRHFDSVNYYNSYLSTHTPRAIDYFARGMDYLTLRDYPAAIADFSRAVETTPTFTLSYLMRAIARLREYQASRSLENSSGVSNSEREKMIYRYALEDLNKTIELSPEMAIAHFNKGVLMLETGDFTSAISAFSRSLEIRPEFGEAYYNRGYAYFRLGNAKAGSKDLSRAGELGVVPSYSLLKRMAP